MMRLAHILICFPARLTILLHNIAKKSCEIKYNFITVRVLFNEQFTNEEKWGNVTRLVEQDVKAQTSSVSPA